MKLITAEQLRIGQTPEDMDDAYIRIPDPLNPDHTLLREVWDVLREPAAFDQVVLIIAPRGAEYRVPKSQSVFYT